MTTSVYFPKISGLTTYSFDGNYLNGVSGVAVRGSGTLTIASGNTISGYYLKVDDNGTGGTLKDGGSGGVSFSNEVWLYAGATVSLTGDSFATYNSFNETGVAAAAQEVDYLAGDTFPGNATMDVLSGPVTTSVYFPKISGLTTYSFDGNYLNGVSGVAVRGGGTLTIASGNTISGYYLKVDDDGTGGTLKDGGSGGVSFSNEVWLYTAATVSLTGDSFATYNSFNETGVAAAAQEVNYLAGDTFPGNATMDVLSGPVTTSVYFPKISGLTTYSFDGNYLNGVSGVAIRGGGTLTIASGNTISGYYLKVDDDGTGGTLKDGGSGGVSFSNEVWLYTGATVSLTGDSFATYNSFNETGVAAAAQEVNYLAGDTFPGNATMDVLSGPVTTSVYFPKISGLTTYSFDGNYLNGVSGVAIRGGGTLTIASGNTISGYYLKVDDDGTGSTLKDGGSGGVSFSNEVWLCTGEQPFRSRATALPLTIPSMKRVLPRPCKRSTTSPVTHFRGMRRWQRTMAAQ